MDGRASRHQCLIYQGSPAVHIDGIAEIIIEKLRANYRCLYLHSPALVSAMGYALGEGGLNVTRETEKGALVLSSDRSHLENGKFNPKKMMALLDKTMRQALADGYAGLWATGDMTWELGIENLDKLLEYEYMLEEFMQKNPDLSGVCQYHHDTLPFHAIQTGLHTHQAVRINQAMMDSNPYYLPPHAKELQGRPKEAPRELQDVIDILRAQRPS